MSALAWLKESHLAELCLQTACSIWRLEWRERRNGFPRRRRVWNRVRWAVRRRRTTATTSPSTSPSLALLDAGHLERVFAREHIFVPADHGRCGRGAAAVCGDIGQGRRHSELWRRLCCKSGELVHGGGWGTRRYSVGSRRSTKWWWCHAGTAPQLHLPNLAVEGDRREVAVRLPPCAGGRMRVPLVHGSVTDGHNAKDRLLT